MNKPVYLGLPILDLSKTRMHEFWYNYVKPKHAENGKRFYTDTDSFIVHVKKDDIYKDISEDVKQDLTLQIKNQTDHCLKKGAKTYSYLIDHGSEDKKAKDSKKCIIKRKLKFEGYKSC